MVADQRSRLLLEAVEAVEIARGLGASDEEFRALADTALAALRDVLERAGKMEKAA